MKNNEKGQVLPVVLFLIAFGGLVITPFLSHAGSVLIGSRIYGEAISQQYSSDAGVEHAIWDLTYDDLAVQLSLPGSSYSYQLVETINSIAPDITVSRGWETIASDNFESGGWAGGTGWLGDWNYTGDASIVTTGTPYEGSYHLRLRTTDGYAERAVDLSSLPSARLWFWAKVNSLEAAEEAYCRISSNGTDWTTVRTWVNGDDDSIYHFYDINLTPYSLSSEFWIAFESNASGTGDQLYVDDLKIVWAFDTAALAASDDFESGGWAGGTGWLYNWNYTGDASIVTAGTPYEGSYHLRLRATDGYAERAVDLSILPNARLQFWAKANSFEASETARCLISSNGIDWTAVRTWVVGDDGNTYHFYDIDLTPYAPSSEFWIAFEANMSGTGDYLYVDALQIRGPAIYGIKSVAGSETSRAVVEIAEGIVIVRWWQVT